MTRWFIFRCFGTTFWWMYYYNFLIYNHQIHTYNNLHCTFTLPSNFNMHLQSDSSNKSFFILIAPDPVNNLQALLKTDNSIIVTCKPPTRYNGPNNGSYHLKVKTGGSDVKNNKSQSCNFYVEDLQYSTTYEFEVRF